MSVSCHVTEMWWNMESVSYSPNILSLFEISGQRWKGWDWEENAADPGWDWSLKLRVWKGEIPGTTGKIVKWCCCYQGWFCIFVSTFHPTLTSKFAFGLNMALSVVVHGSWVFHSKRLEVYSPTTVLESNSVPGRSIAWCGRNLAYSIDFL